VYLSTRLNRVALSSVALGILGALLILMLLFTLVAHAHLGSAHATSSVHPYPNCGGTMAPC
jgi:hypothetical protein